eukprot:scaffold8477_cov112-Isochrysis_galbana.AAC.13
MPLTLHPHVELLLLPHSLSFTGALPPPPRSPRRSPPPPVSPPPPPQSTREWLLRQDKGSFYGDCLAERRVELCEGARVILLVNLDLDAQVRPGGVQAKEGNPGGGVGVRDGWKAV